MINICGVGLFSYLYDYKCSMNLNLNNSQKILPFMSSNLLMNECVSNV